MSKDSNKTENVTSNSRFPRKFRLWTFFLKFMSRTIVKHCFLSKVNDLSFQTQLKWSHSVQWSSRTNLMKTMKIARISRFWSLIPRFEKILARSGWPLGLWRSWKMTHPTRRRLRVLPKHVRTCLWSIPMLWGDSQDLHRRRKWAHRDLKKSDPLVHFCHISLGFWNQPQLVNHIYILQLEKRFHVNIFWFSNMYFVQ